MPVAATVVSASAVRPSDARTFRLAMRGGECRSAAETEAELENDRRGVPCEQ